VCTINPAALRVALPLANSALLFHSAIMVFVKAGLHLGVSSAVGGSSIVFLLLNLQ
jgi:hypothetical protein